MSIKFSLSSNPRTYITVPDVPALTYPNSDWVLGFTIVIDGSTAATSDSPQYILGTGVYQTGGGLGVLLQPHNGAADGGKFGAYVNGAGSVQPYSAVTEVGKAYTVVLSRVSNAVRYRVCPVLTTAPTDGSSVSTVNTNVPTLAVAMDCASALIIGERSGARRLDHSLCRVFRYDGTLTDFEVAQLAYGKEITDLGKTPAWYFRLNNNADVTDIGPNTLSSSTSTTLTNGTPPGFGYVAATTPPAFTSAPVINGTPQVNSSIGYTAGTFTGSPYPATTQQWTINGVDIAGATGATYIPVAGDYNKTLAVRQIATNSQGPASSTSSGVVVVQAANTVTLNPPTAERIYQRINGSATVAWDGAFSGTTPTTIEYQLYAIDGSTIRQAWTNANATIVAGGTWSANIVIPVHAKKYRVAVQSKNSSGVVIYTSEIYANRFGVGDIIGCIGSSTVASWFGNISGGSLPPDVETISYFDSIGWRVFDGNGAATTMASYLAGVRSCPVAMMAYGYSGTRLDVNFLGENADCWVAFKNGVIAVGGKLAGVLASMGSNDAAGGYVSSRSSHAANIRTIITKCRTLTGQSDLQILWSGFNRRTSTTISQASFDIVADYVRLAENDIGDDANVRHVQVLDLELGSDGVHLTKAGFIIQCDRNIKVFAGAYVRGPKITSITYNGSLAKVNIALRNGTDFIPASGITGFVAADSTGVLNIVSSVRTSSSLITLNFDRVVSSVPTVTYLSGSAPAVGTPVFDNTVLALPMTMESSLVATQETVSDTTPPTMVGSVVSSSITTTSFTLTWQAATDAIGVTGYEVSYDNGSTYIDVGNVLTTNKTGLTPATLYSTKVRAYDAALNKATPLSLAVTTATPADGTAPVMNGSITISGQTSNSFVMSWQAASDNVAVTGYKVSTDGGSTYVDVGNVLTSTRGGLAASTTYNVRVYAYDAAANVATPLSTTATTIASADVTAPVMTGTISVTAINAGGFTFSYTAATDNVAVTGYEVSVDTGTASYTSVGNVLSVAKVGLSSSTLYNIRVRAFDAAGNRSNILSTTATTAAAQSLASSLTLTFKNRAGVVQANLTGMKWAFFDNATPDTLLAPSAKGTGASTNSSGILVLNVTGTQLVPGATGWLVFSNSDGTASQSNLISFAGPCVVA